MNLHKNIYTNKILIYESLRGIHEVINASRNHEPWPLTFSFKQIKNRPSIQKIFNPNQHERI